MWKEKINMLKMLWLMILTCKYIEVRRNHKCQTIDGAKTFVLKLYASNASYFTQKGQLFVILLLKKITNQVLLIQSGTD